MDCIVYLVELLIHTLVLEDSIKQSGIKDSLCLVFHRTIDQDKIKLKHIWQVKMYTC